MINSFKRLSIIFLIAIIGFASCDDKAVTEKSKSTNDSSATFDLSAVRSAIEKSNAAMADEIAKGDSTAVAAHYTKDAKLMPDGFPAVSGNEGIRGMWAGFISTGMKVKFNIPEVYGDKDLVIEEGTFVLSDKAGTELEKGKYIVLWKQEDGQWKMFRDIWNADARPIAAK